MTVAYVALGSNVGDRLAFLRAAADALRRVPGTELLCASSVYETDPVGPPQPDYLNAVVELETTLDAHDLYTALKAVESDVGRTPSERWGPREIDLDLLLHGDQRVDADVLVVPHPRLHERPFVLVPLAEIAPDAQVPGRGRVAGLLSAVGGQGVRRVHPPDALTTP